MGNNLRLTSRTTTLYRASPWVSSLGSWRCGNSRLSGGFCQRTGMDDYCPWVICKALKGRMSTIFWLSTRRNRCNTSFFSHPPSVRCCPLFRLSDCQLQIRLRENFLPPPVPPLQSTSRSKKRPWVDPESRSKVHMAAANQRIANWIRFFGGDWGTATD